MRQEPAYTFDPLTQREELDDPHEARRWVTHLEAQGLVGDPMRVIWLRILGDLDEAEDLGWQVLARSGGPAGPADAEHADLPLSAVAAAIRLAHVLQWQGRFPHAYTLLHRALESIDAVEPMHEDSGYADHLRPFAYQHLARCYYDEGEYHKALGVCERALELRIDAGVPEEQVRISHQLIEAVHSRLAAQGLNAAP